MEEQVFLSPAVAALMNKHLVESRLHTDSQNTLTDEQFAKNKQLQSEIAGTIANPFFVVVDPDSGKKLGVFKLSGDYTSWKDKWFRFVQKLAKDNGRA